MPIKVTTNAGSVGVGAPTGSVKLETPKGNGGEYDETRLLEVANKVAPSPARVTLYADRWQQNENEQRWHQEVIVENATITKYSKVDLQLSAEQITIFYEKDLALVTENDNGKVFVYCIGQVPKSDYVIQATVAEVVVSA